jgi:RimJ/RimL family protein N-acetyltransferase
LNHDLSLRGHAFALRPVVVSDAGFIVELRNARGRYLSRGVSSEIEQRLWIERYFAHPCDYYFVVQRSDNGVPEGLVGIYDVDPEQRTAEWGRFVLQPGSRAAVEAVLLVYRCGFDVMGLDRICCRTLADNAQVVAFHDSCGLDRASAPTMIEHDGQQRQAIEHVLLRDRWPTVFERLNGLAERLAESRRRVLTARQ